MAKHTVHTKEALGRKTADVVKHGSGKTAPDKHYEIDVGSSVFAKYEDTPRGAFLAGNGRIRPQPHKMINECDH